MTKKLCQNDKEGKILVNWRRKRKKKKTNRNGRELFFLSLLERLNSREANGEVK